MNYSLVKKNLLKFFLSVRFSRFLHKRPKFLTKFVLKYFLLFLLLWMKVSFSFSHYIYWLLTTCVQKVIILFTYSISEAGISVKSPCLYQSFAQALGISGYLEQHKSSDGLLPTSFYIFYSILLSNYTVLMAILCCSQCRWECLWGFIIKLYMACPLDCTHT